MTMTDLDWMVDDYLRQLEGALRSLPAARRSQIVAEISDHVSQARAGLATQDEESIRDLLRQVGTPGDIAAAAIAEGAPPARRRGPRRRRVLLAPAGVALLVLIGVVAYLVQSGSSPATMPNVIGKSADAAESVLESLGVRHVDLIVEGSLAPADTVFGTNTRVGATLRPGQQVNLQISSGPSSVPVLTGLGAARAEQELNALGLRWAIVRVYRQGSGHLVVTQAPAAGAKLEKQSWVEIGVTSSSTAVPTTMPSIGLFMPPRYAIAELHSLGLRLHVRYVTRPGTPAGGWVTGFTTPGTRLTSAGAYLAVAQPPT